MGMNMPRSAAYEIESLLYEVDYCGYVVIPLRKLYRLLNKGNKAAGTWRALLDVWEETGHERADLNIADLPGDRLLLTNVTLDSVTRWAGEK
jgi:hypothetical protein